MADEKTNQGDGQKSPSPDTKRPLIKEEKRSKEGVEREIVRRTDR
jgi:hypothetical protein